jgi:anti-sigma factor RsiW
MTDSTARPGGDADLRLLIQALVDGELDAAAALALERRIAGDPALAAEHARLTAVKAAVQRLPRPELSEAFRARIAALAAPEETEAEATAPPARLSFDWRALAASVVMTAILASGTTAFLMQGEAPDSFAEAIASGHRRSLLAASPIDIASSDRHTVKPWLDAKVGLSPPATDLAQFGYPLLGGRVDVIADRVVPSLVYRHREHLITLVAAPQEQGATSAAAPVSAGGFSLVHWTDGAFSYWAISDMARPELDDFVARFREAAKNG